MNTNDVIWFAFLAVALVAFFFAARQSSKAMERSRELQDTIDGLGQQLDTMRRKMKERLVLVEMRGLKGRDAELFALIVIDLETGKTSAPTENLRLIGQKKDLAARYHIERYFNENLGEELLVLPLGVPRYERISGVENRIILCNTVYSLTPS